jgi:hypothetical protein
VHAIDVEKPSIAHAAYYETDLRDPDAIDATVARGEGVLDGEEQRHRGGLQLVGVIRNRGALTEGIGELIGLKEVLLAIGAPA